MRLVGAQRGVDPCALGQAQIADTAGYSKILLLQHNVQVSSLMDQIGSLDHEHKSSPRALPPTEACRFRAMDSLNMGILLMGVMSASGKPRTAELRVCTALHCIILGHGLNLVNE